MRGVLTVLHLVNSPASTFRPSMTISPAITALVVAMAGIMFPAMAEGEGRGGGERWEGRGGGERGGGEREKGERASRHAQLYPLPTLILTTAGRWLHTPA